MGWVQDSWHAVTNVGTSTWLAWAAIALGVIALVPTNRQLNRNRPLVAEQARPHVAMLVEPHPADWHVIELVVRNFGRTAAYDIGFSFSNRPTVAEYENATAGYADVVELQRPAICRCWRPARNGAPGSSTRQPMSACAGVAPRTIWASTAARRRSDSINSAVHSRGATHERPGLLQP